MKRGYDNYHSSRGHHGPSNFPPNFKKYRRDDVDPVNPTPSKVLHIRNLTQETTEADLLSALSHFGNVAYTTLMANGHMALAEFATMDQARACIAYSKTHQIMVRNHPVLINYSTSEKIQRSGLESEDPSRVIVLTITNVTYPISVDTLKEICSEHGKVNRVALIKRSGLLQALVEFEDAEQATKAKYGLNGADIYDNACTLKVEFGRMTTVKVTANNADQWDYTGDPALNPNNENTEHDESNNGRNEYDVGDDASWRRDAPPSGRRHEPDASFTQPNSYASGGGYVPTNNYDTNYRGRGSSNFRGRGGTYDASRGRGGYTGHTEGFFNNDRSNSYDSGYSSRGGERGGGSSYRGRGAPRGGGGSGWNNDRQNGGGHDDGYGDSREYYDRREHGGSSRGGYHDSRGGGRGNSSWRGGHERSSYRGGESDRYEGHGGYDNREHGNYSDDKNSHGGAGFGPNWNGAVVMVYGVNPAQFTCDRLFNLLCCYGNCLKIKYMHSKPDTCMVQMGSSEEATAVIEHLQECQVFGTALSFRPSKQNIVHNVSEPHTLADGSPAFRDYTSSTVHRFSSPQMAALNKIVFPNPELYWYNAPPIMSEDVMKKLFTQKHAPIPVQVTLLESSTSSSGLLRFATTAEASEALMICNNMVIAGGQNSPPFVFKLSYASPEHKKAY